MLEIIFSFIRSLLISPRYDEVLRKADAVAEQNKEVARILDRVLDGKDNGDPIQSFVRHLEKARRR